MRRSLTRTFSVPTASQAGDFSGSATICDPLTIPSTGVCTPFAATESRRRLDPLAVAFLEHVPAPTSAAALQNLTAIEQQDKDVDQFSLRVDHRLGWAISSSRAEHVRRERSPAVRQQQPSGNAGPRFGRTLNTKARNVAVSYTPLPATRSLNDTVRMDAGQGAGRSARIAEWTSPARSACRA